ncbi:HEXXH motif-containing putative peptide modification protein [Nocardia sp. NBC_00565]|uniref:aKG-HExxH-type peptide beta-hydroxylase n=1 Tax=Nocardia sp. NBC_00565 TaxID=2975993 RepID=UPI002E8135AA|nr:HEXXH motif-containing putative peptide modification protein [Nocardia sp. NBC_00565]WUC03785.1 HEXXH motif-containing putative peptide modification protein [Nocardia sp. NBC_00565]
MDVENLVVRLATAPDDVDLVQLLAKAQLGKHLVQIAALAKRQSRANLTLLTEVQSTAPQVFRGLLLDPGIVAGARRDTGPLAAAAAIAARVPATVGVDLRHGEVTLPTLGTIRFPLSSNRFHRESATIHVDVQDGRTAVSTTAAGVVVELPDDLTTPTASWQPLPRIAVGHTAHLNLTLATDGPLADVYGAPEIFRSHSLDDWQQAIGAGWRLLEAERPGHAAALAAGLRTIVPIPAEPNGDATSCTIDGMFGAVYMSFPEDPASAAVTLVHEFQHAKLAAALDIAVLYTKNDEAAHYAPWRGDPRPLGALLQGVYAHLGVAQFWGTHRTTAHENALRADTEFARWRDDTWQACQGIVGDPAFTDVGRAFVEALAAELNRLRKEPVQVAAAELAERITLDHAVSWRLRNFAVDPHAATQIAAAWLAQEQPDLPPVDSLVQRTPQPREISAVRTQLMYCRMAGTLRPGTDADADLLCALGSYEQARDAYADRIHRDPDDLDAWAGLALSVPPHDPARHSLRTIPEVVAGSYRQATLLGSVDPEPVELARWLAQAT